MDDQRLTATSLKVLPVLKALGDDTRFAIFQELTLATSALSAGAIASRISLHPNTVRPHLERMREVGLIEVETAHRGMVGRPQHLYSLAAGAPGLGLDPPAHTLLAGLLAAVAERVGTDPDDAAEIGRSWGMAKVARRTKSFTCLEQLVGELDHLGFEPAVESLVADDLAAGDAALPATRVAFLHCPFRELAEAYPELVCNVHRGIVEGIVERSGSGSVEAFSTLYDRDPCNVTVSSSVS